MNLHLIEQKNFIGGRYSVFAEVGMLPAYLMGLNINEIKKNCLINFNLKNQNFLKDSSVKLTNLLLAQKFNNLIFFNYVPQLNKFLYWAQQLIAESLGKKGKGFLPLVSEAPKDQHSLLQLYLDGPKDKIFYIFSSKKEDHIKLNAKVLGNEFNFLTNNSLNQIKNAQKNAFIKVLKKKKFPLENLKLRILQNRL